VNHLSAFLAVLPFNHEDLYSNSRFHLLDHPHPSLQSNTAHLRAAEYSPPVHNLLSPYSPPSERSSHRTRLFPIFDLTLKPHFTTSETPSVLRPKRHGLQRKEARIGRAGSHRPLFSNSCRSGLYKNTEAGANALSSNDAMNEGELMEKKNDERGTAWTKSIIQFLILQSYHSN
jgi:hypothetical protein